MRFGTVRLLSAIFQSPLALSAAIPQTAFFAKPACRKRFSWFVVIGLCMFGPLVATAQDIRGLEVCTAEKDMTRRTSCLQSNVELLQQELTKQARRAQEDRANAAKEVTALKAELATIKTALEKTQGDLAELKKKPAEKDKK
jgi:septal ring factor EnvC (AmiA/AmiB activator)